MVHSITGRRERQNAWALEHSNTRFGWTSNNLDLDKNGPEEPNSFYFALKFFALKFFALKAGKLLKSTYFNDMEPCSHGFLEGKVQNGAVGMDGRK